MRRRRVLIVEDREDNANALCAGVSASGYAATIATDGRSALEIAEAERPDAVLMDLGLPDVSGYDICRRLRARPWGEGILIVAVTGWTRESDRAAARAAGFDYYVLKPVTFETLDALLQDIERRAAGPAD